MKQQLQNIHLETDKPFKTGSHNATGDCLWWDPENPPAAPEPQQTVVIVVK